MSLFARKKVFQKLATGILLIFLGLMLLVSLVAYSRLSGSTHQDMAQAQFIRYKAMHKKSIKEIATATKGAADTSINK